MKNRIVGILIVCISVLIGFIVLSFNLALRNIVNAACSHGPSCPMWGTINFQTNVSLAVMVLVLLVGLYLIFFGKEERIVTKVKRIKEHVKPKKLSKEDFKDVLSKMNENDKKIFEAVIDSGDIYQSKLAEKTGFTKVKVSRILDRLEGKGLIERKRRGMTNIVILKA
ncbi:MarR family transcriptional regulator [Candidatus Woesearchaeota archaeon]|nr:MarR family transcriptional regulator [Candidatus Woesearchaeota archaeon]